MTTMKAIATGCMLLATSGCSSVMSHTGPNQGYYPGTRASVDMLKDDKHQLGDDAAGGAGSAVLRSDGYRAAALRLSAFR